MARKKRPSLPIAENNEAGYFSFTDDFAESAKQAGYQGGDGFSAGNYMGSFVHIDNNLSARNPYTRGDYEYFRPNEKIPTKPKEIIAVCMNASRRIGVVNRVMNLMAEFACQGISLKHSDPKTQKYYKRWFEKVRGKERSERFSSLLVRSGHVPVHRATAKVSPSMLEKKDFAISADLEVEVKEKPKKNEIPVRYTFLNPLSLDVVEPELSMLAGKPIYGIKMDRKLIEKIKKPNGKVQEELLEKLPADIKEAALNSDGVYILNPKKFQMFFYKKDDWELWGLPLLYPILSDIFQLEKTKMADIAALDGAISSVRLWRLGSLEHQIMPKPGQIQRLSNILTSNAGGGAIDLVWGPELDFKESDSKLHNFLGKEKYEAVMNQIYAGLGIPPTLTGTGGGNTGFTNNYVSLKTFIQALEYVRAILLEFWNEEIRLVQQAKGFLEPAHVTFEHMSLSDEAAEKKLWIDLADRDLISTETLQEKFGEIPELEQLRMKKEQKMRKSDKLPAKASPWHNPQHDNDLEKIALQTEQVTPSQLGLELEEPSPDDKEKIQLQKKIMQKQSRPDPKPMGGGFPPSKKPSGIPGQGRPKNSVDTKPRKQRAVKPRSAAEVIKIYNWARKSYSAIADILDPYYLELCNKSNMRGLTHKESDAYEKLKLGVLSQMKPFSPIDKEEVKEVLNSRIPLYSGLAAIQDKLSHGAETLDEHRNTSCLSYAYFTAGYTDEDL